jgi:hypothetical protein
MITTGAILMAAQGMLDLVGQSWTWKRALSVADMAAALTPTIAVTSQNRTKCRAFFLEALPGLWT